MTIKDTTARSRLWQIVRFLIEPPPNLTDIRQKHQIRLLSALLLIIIFLGGLSGIIQLLTVPDFYSTFVAIVSAVFVLCFAYVLTRMNYYLYAALLTAFTPFMASYIALMENTKDQSAFAFMLISVLLSSMLLSRWLTLAVALLNLLGLILLPVIQPAWTTAIVTGKISFHILISALILIAMRQRDLIEEERQKQISESELKFRSIFDYSVDAIGVSINGIHIMTNPAYVRMFRCKSADQLIGRSILDLIAPPERARIRENIYRRASGAEVATFYETRGLRCDGTEFDMEVHVSTYSLDGQLYTVPILRDITERKRTEEILRTSEEAYKLLFESNPQPMWVYDTNTLAFLAVNDEAVLRYGYSKDDFLGMTIKDIRPKEDVPKLMDNIAHLSFGLDHAGDWRHLKKDGSLIEVEITSHVLPFDGKQAELVVANDITARKAAEYALQKSELRYRAIVESTTDLICRFLPDTTLTFVNEAYCRYFGRTREQLIGTQFLKSIPESEWAGVKSQVNHVFHTKKPFTYSHEVMTLEGEIRWQQWTDCTILNDDGDVIELQSVGRDVTESHYAEEVLRASEKRYRFLAQNLPDSLLFLFDHQFRVIVADGPELAINGLSSAMLEGKTLREAFPATYATMFEVNLNRSMTGERFTVEFPHGDNLYRYSFVPIHDDSGRVAMAMILGMNITRLRNTEDALRESQRRLDTALRATKVGVWEWDMRTNMASWSDENYKVLGYEPGEINATYENWAKALHPEDLANAENRVADAINHQGDLNIEFRVLWPDGSTHWINDIGSVLVDDLGNTLGMYGIQIDVSERKQGEWERETLIRELEEKNLEAETLRHSAAFVALSLDLKETASRILDQLQRVVPYNSASVQLLVEGKLRVVDGRGYPDSKNPTDLEFLFDHNDPAYSIQSNDLPYVLVSDVQDVSHSFSDFFHNHIHSWIAVPLHARGRLIGLLTVDGFLPGMFTEQHAQFTATFANQVAVTLENSRLYTDLQKELDERQKTEKALRQREIILNAITDSAELLLKSPDWKSVIDEILEKLGRTIGASHAYIFESHPGAGVEVLLSIRHEWSASGFPSDIDNPLYRNMSLHEFGLERWYELVVLQSQPFVGDSIRSSREEMNILNSRGIKAIVDMPIIVNEKWWGVIGFDDMLHNHAWDKVEVDALRVAANVLSSAIQRQLYDITLMDELHKRKTLIEELENKNAELERFTYTVSHDLKSPIVTIKGFLGFLKQDVASGNMQRFEIDLERISGAATKMEQLLKDLLELSRIGRVLNPMARIPFNTLIDEVLSIVHGQVEMRGIRVSVQPNLPLIYGDRQRLTEVLQNLIDNAAKYMGDQASPQIDVGMSDMTENEYLFFVRDNGMGIPSQYHERVFGLFNKLDLKSEGTGVGLALVKRIIEFHGGRIWIESEGKNMGATFYFTLPRRPEDLGRTKNGE
jgi:PAS domain S-box-containing protein